MGAAMPFAGYRVLVVDDDFYLAEDACAALEQAGASVQGPYGSATDALASLQANVPELAVIDLNLGSGPEFDIARRLKTLGVPTLIVTGYDGHIIPDDLAGICCLHKPVTSGKLVAAAAALVGGA